MVHICQQNPDFLSITFVFTPFVEMCSTAFVSTELGFSSTTLIIKTSGSDTRQVQSAEQIRMFPTLAGLVTDHESVHWPDKFFRRWSLSNQFVISDGSPALDFFSQFSDPTI